MLLIACPQQNRENLLHTITECLRLEESSASHVLQPLLEQGHLNQVAQDYVWLLDGF